MLAPKRLCTTYVLVYCRRPWFILLGAHHAQSPKTLVEAAHQLDKARTELNETMQHMNATLESMKGYMTEGELQVAKDFKAGFSLYMDMIGR